MLSFHNDVAVKQKYLSRVIAHAAADKLVKGTGWNNGKGCAIGCTLEAYDHSRYPIELGLPEWLARLEDTIFEGLPNELAMSWPARFLEAVPVGVDVEIVRHKLALRRIDRLIAIQQEAAKKNHAYGVSEAISQTLAALMQVRRCHEAEIGGNTCDVSFAESAESATSAARSARSAARSARSAAESARSARSAAESAAESARSAAWSAAESAAWSPWSAAESAAWSAAESAAWSPWSAAESAAWSAAESARSARSARSAAESAAWSAARSAAESARSAAFVQESEDLLELLRECSIPTTGEQS